MKSATASTSTPPRTASRPRPRSAAAAPSVSVTAADATIYVTTDGTDPRYSNTRALVSSGASVTLEEGQTLRAYAFTDAKYPSPVVEKAYSA
ncbi:MAG: chitobiase/beta-hexosaminidase C-terminal domain-containing protein [Lachnospiraceae bacterium]